MITHFGTMPDGQAVDLITLKNQHLRVGLLTYGASLQRVCFEGQDVHLSSETLSDYLGELIYSGAIVGRVANRISGARALIGSKTFMLDANEPNGNCLHGGVEGASHMVWTHEESGPDFAVLSLHMPDGHMGFPGALDVRARYQLHDAVLRLDISATSDQETLCAFASHGYWNLSGEQQVNQHRMLIFADRYLPLDDRNTPTGEIASVAGTMFDFTEMRLIDDVAVDHNWCISQERTKLRPVLSLHSSKSRIAMDVSSTEAGVQVYDARHLGRRSLAIEPQVWPDAANHPDFPSMTLQAGETYESTTEFRFSKLSQT